MAEGASVIVEQLNALLSAAEVPIVRRDGGEHVWSEVFDGLSYNPVGYANSSLDYQSAYQRGHGGVWTDLSLIAYWNNKPIAIWPLSYSVKNGESKLSSQGQPVMPPLFSDECPLVTRKRIVKSFLEIANALAINTDKDTWESSESFRNSLGMSEWHIESMGLGADCGIRHELYLDLTRDLTEIRGGFRKSYKSLIAAGNKLWAVKVLDSADEAVWGRFKRLHLQVSGRITRSDETWALQHEQIQSGEAFLVWLENSAGEMVGGGLFNCMGKEGLYAVAAYDRALFDKPLGHVVQYRAIEELKRRNALWYKIGARPYRSDVPAPNDKEISIADFKQGFASHVFPNYLLTHKVIK